MCTSMKTTIKKPQIFHCQFPMVNSRNAFTLIELLCVILIINLVMAIMLPSLSAMRETVRRGQCQSNLSKIVLAVKGHEEAYGVLPSGTINDTGPIRNIPVGRHHGWIARVLPFLEQMPMYQAIDFDKSVYDTENQVAWLTPTGETLVCPSQIVTKSPLSTYMACHDGEETPIDTENRGVFFLNSTLRSKDISDGNSHTIWLGEGWADGNHSLGWISGTPGTIRNTGTPINERSECSTNWPMPFSEKGDFDAKILPYQEQRYQMPAQLFVGGFGSLHPGGANFAMGDGSVRMLFTDLDDAVYRQLGRRDDAGPRRLDD